MNPYCPMFHGFGGAIRARSGQTDLVWSCSLTARASTKGIAIDDPRGSSIHGREKPPARRGVDVDAGTGKTHCRGLNAVPLAARLARV